MMNRIKYAWLILLVLLAAGCAAPRQWQTLPDFFDEFEDVPDAHGVSAVLGGNEFYQLRSGTTDVFVFKGIAIGSREWDGMVKTHYHETSADIVVVAQSGILDNNRNDDEVLCKELTQALGNTKIAESGFWVWRKDGAMVCLQAKNDRVVFCCVSQKSMG